MHFTWSARRASLGAATSGLLERGSATSVALVVAALVVTATGACTREREEPDAGRVVGLDAGRDAPVIMSCMNASDCDDGFPCTIDNCGVGNRCEWIPLDSECADGETCVVGRGCQTGTPTDCMTDTDCDDGRRCTGREQCLLGMCRVTEPYVCNDGNECTDDRCDATRDDCVFERSPTCDSGTMGMDAGPLCTPFEASSVYSGTFIVPMAPSQGCGLVPAYTASPIAFSIAGGTLTARATGFTMTQTPAPTGADFDVRGDADCAHFRLTGTFTCGNQGTAMFSATFDSECSGICRDQVESVMLLR